MTKVSDELALVRSLREQNEDLTKENTTLKSGGGGGTSDGMVEHLPDLRHRIGRLEVGFCSAFLLIVVAAWALYSAMHGDYRGLDDRLRGVEISQARTEGKIDALGGKLDAMNGRMDGLQKTLDERLPVKR